MKIKFEATDCVPRETLARNVAYAKSLGLPFAKARASILAVVGGGPSVADHCQELISWPGEIWAINGAYNWLRDKGIKARFFSTDPLPGVVEYCIGADAVLATRCSLAAFSVCDRVEIVDLEDASRGPSTASCAPLIAAEAGFESVHFFGCEGNYGAETHVYGTPRNVRLLEVKCNGEVFLTSPQMLMQAEYLSEVIRKLPFYCHDRSGGLLAACIADPDVDVIAASQSIHDALKGAA